jgi:hypothetical protein
MLPLALLLFSHPLLRTNRTSAYHIGTGAMGGRRWRWGEAQLKDENEDEDEMRRSFFLGLGVGVGGGVTSSPLTPVRKERKKRWKREGKWGILEYDGGAETLCISSHRFSRSISL